MRKQVACNLAEIVSTYIPNLQLEAELEKLGHHEMAHLDQTSKKSDTTDQPDELENKPVTTVLGTVDYYFIFLSLSCT